MQHKYICYLNCGSLLDQQGCLTVSERLTLYLDKYDGFKTRVCFEYGCSCVLVKMLVNAFNRGMRQSFRPGKSVVCTSFVGKKKAVSNFNYACH